jgi:cytochrome c556
VRGAGSASAPEIDGVVSLQKDIQAKAKANDIEAIAVNAGTIAINATHIPVLFPQGSAAEKSRAKPEIWQKWTHFAADAKALQTMAEQLRDTAKAKNADAPQAIVRDFQKQTCDTCCTLRLQGMFRRARWSLWRQDGECCMHAAR